MSGPLERNLIWYRRHQVVAGALFWGPTTFLYFISRFGLADALRAQLVYYVAVVAMEVPSGRFSDRFGRALTLRIVGVSWIAAHLLFLTTPGFVGVAIAQVLLAAGYAFLSGSDVTMHLETLEGLGRVEEYRNREAAVRRLQLWARGASALAGGALGAIDLRLPFAAALLAAAVQLTFATRFVDPPRDAELTANLDHGVRRVLGHLRTPILRWLTCYVAVSVLLVHLAGDLAAPYLTDALDADPDSPGAAALLNGAVAAVVAGVSALALRAIVPLAVRLGLVVALLGLALVPLASILAMSLVTSVWLLPLLATRGVANAAVAVLAPPVVAGHVGTEGRSTFLSVASLSGRLVYAGALLGLSWQDGDVGGTLVLASVVGAGSWLAVTLFAATARPWPRALDHGHDHGHPVIEHSHLHVHNDLHHEHHAGPNTPGADDEIGDAPHRHVHRHTDDRHEHPHLRDGHHDHDHDQT